jgi:putative flippase GtrA
MRAKQWQVWPAYRSVLLRLGKFIIVGGVGVFVNTAALFILYQLLGLPLVAASLIAVEISIINNFVLNDRWTFEQNGLSLRRFVKFNAVSSGGLVITTLTLWLLVNRAGMRYIFANLAGIVLATTWNFVLNAVWTWGAPHRFSQGGAERRSHSGGSSSYL